MQTNTTDDTELGASTLWPPGTIYLQKEGVAGSRDVILQPRPSRDPNEPLNWSRWRKIWNFGLVCFYVIMVTVFIDVATPTWGPMQKELGFSDAILDDSYAAGCGALAIGSFVMIPFALKYGRRPLYLFSTIVQFALSIWSAKLVTVADLMLINILQCFFGSLGESLVQMTVADLFFVHQRGRMSGLYVWLWQVCAALGVLIAGYITTGQGWRWVWWWCDIVFGVFVLLVAFSFEETKYIPPITVATLRYNDEETEREQDHSQSPTKMEPIVLKSSETESRGIDQKTVSDNFSASRLNIDHNIPMETYWQRMRLTTTIKSGGLSGFLRHMYIPFITLFTIPAVAFVGLVYGVLIALGDVMTTTLSTYMTKPPYNFDASEIGLMSIPKIIGLTVGSLIGSWSSDWLILVLARRNKGIYEPESRLWSVVPFLILVPIGSVMFAIGLSDGLSWPIIAIGLGIYRAAQAPINSIVITYLTDSYEDIIGDALVAVTIVRNTFSTVFIFALPPWIAAIGLKWTFVIILVITCLALMLVGIFIKWGKVFRARSAARYIRYSQTF